MNRREFITALGGGRFDEAKAAFRAAVGGARPAESRSSPASAIGADGPPIQSDQVCPWRKPMLGIRRRDFMSCTGTAITLNGAIFCTRSADYRQCAPTS
jgi:hypothetical protein